MSTDAVGSIGTLSRFEQLRMGREVVRSEGQALIALASRVDEPFCQAVELVLACAGNVIVTGMGKAGLIGQKVAATLASTGTSSHFLHPGEAVHGDLGRIHRLDMVLALSMSGETPEVTRLLPSLQDMGCPIVALTGAASSTLGRNAQVVLDLGPVQEVCSLGLAPSTSTTAMLALGDALALVVSRARGFRREDFARFHPGGALGRRLAKVDEVMRPLRECRVAAQQQTVREVLVRVSRPGRRTGVVMLVGAGGELTGVFTDSDLARMLEHHQDASLDQPMEQVMTRRPTTIRSGAWLSEAIDILAIRKISELPVVDEAGAPLGVIDITDVVSGHDASPATCTSDQDRAGPWRQRTVRFPNRDRR